MKRTVPSSNAAEDSQIDLLTLASALMLTVVCLLLSQILRDVSSTTKAEPGDLPSIHRLRVKLEMPWADSSTSLEQSRGHTLVATRLTIQRGTSIHTLEADDTLHLQEADSQCRVTFRRHTPQDVATEFAELSLELEQHILPAEEFSFDTLITVTNAINALEIPIELISLWNAMVDVAKENPSLLAYRTENIPIVFRQTCSLLTFYDFNSTGDQTAIVVPTLYLLPSAGGRTFAGLCVGGVQVNQNQQLIDDLFSRALPAIASAQKEPFARMSFVPAAKLTSGDELSFTYRIRIASPPIEDEGAERLWSVHVIPVGHL